jgi:FlaA1/EpsC-like NDP-sugar epimerase
VIDFDIESFVRKYVTKRSESLLKTDFERNAEELHRRIDGKKMLVIGGAGTIGSNYVKAALKSFRPAAMYVVDIDENQMTELTRELRSSAVYTVPDEYVTEPIDLGSELFARFYRAKGPFDIVANFAARKHVRAERDVFSIEAMCDTNVFMAKKLLDILVENPPEAFFCVSTDKAANPVNVMGATKKLMEEAIMAYSDKVPIKTARFANVAFSNGSLPIGWINRIQKRQPIVCPTGVRRFFVSPVESGELCLFASVMADSGDIVYPKLDPDADMVTFDSFLPDFLKATGHEDWDVRYPAADTDGEKPYEEFYTDTDIKDEDTFQNLGVVKNAKKRPVEEVESMFERFRAVFQKDGATKEDVVGMLGEYLPNFHHIGNGKSLDGRM